MKKKDGICSRDDIKDEFHWSDQKITLKTSVSNKIISWDKNYFRLSDGWISEDAIKEVESIINNLFDGPVNLATQTNKKIVLVSYLRDNATINEAIGTLMLYVPTLSFSCSDRVPNGNIKISGTTTDSEEIKIYVQFDSYRFFI